MTPEEKAAVQAVQDALTKAGHFDETLKVINHWLANVHGLAIEKRDYYWWGFTLEGDSVDIRRETYSQCLAAVLDHISGRQEGS